MNPKIPIATFSFSADWRPLEDALNAKDPYEAEVFLTSPELVHHLSTLSGCLVICSLRNKDDLLQIATFMKTYKRMVKGVIKVVVVNFSGNKQFEAAIGKLGILDIVDFNINTKALRFKIDFWMKSLKAQVKNLPGDTVQKVEKKAEADVVLDKKITDQIAWLPPLDCEDDIWLIRKEGDCKKVLSRWLVKFLGPSPYVAQWVEVKPKLWKFEFKSESRAEFIDGEGTWFYTGDQKPEFIWKEDVWLVTGDFFELYYESSDGTFLRAKLKEKHLSLSKNSEFARFKEKLLLQSCDKELTVRKQADKASAKTLESDEGRGQRNLEGKGKTDHLSGGPLSGESSTDDLSSDPFSMDLDPSARKDDGPLMGPGSGPVRQGQLLDMENSALEESPELSYESDEQASSPELSYDNKNHEHQTKYKNHNTPEIFEKGQLGGSSKTEKLDGFYKNGLETSQEDDAEFAENRRRRSEGKSEKGAQSSAPKLIPDDRPAREDNVVSLDKVRREREAAEKSIEALTEDMEIKLHVSQSGSSIDCAINDFFDKTLIISTTSLNVKFNEPIVIDFLCSYQKKSKSANFSGTITNVEDDGEGEYYISIEVSGEQLAEFENVLKVYQERQNSINDFMSLVRGI